MRGEALAGTGPKPDGGSGGEDVGRRRMRRGGGETGENLGRGGVGRGVDHVCGDEAQGRLVLLMDA